MLENHGTLSAVVWSTYLGVAEVLDGALVEPSMHIDYRRGQIVWKADDSGDIRGQARVWLPKGLWTHFVFCHHPIQEHVIGSAQMDHPTFFDRAGFMDVYPIHNQEILPRL